MIVPMKKIYLIVQKKDQISALEEVRNLGVVHVEHQEEISTPKISDLKAEQNMLENVIQHLRGLLKQAQKKSKKIWVIEKELKNVDFDPVQKAKEIISLLAEIEEIKEAMSIRRIEILKWEPWGDFDPQDLQVIEAQGLYVYLGESRTKEQYVLPEEVMLEEVGNENGVRRFLAISSEKVDLPFTVIEPPSSSLEDLKAQQNHDQKEIDHIEEELLEYLQFIEIFEQSLEEHKGTVRFEETVKGMKDFEALVLLKGYCPVDVCDSVKDRAKSAQWGFCCEDPDEEDQVPTLLRNPKWMELISPVLKIVEIVPGYKEFDVSLVFLIFFTLFFGILIGDAAYGLIFAGATFFAQKKWGASMKDRTPFILGYLLTGFTIVWGLLTGTFFGQQWLPATVKPLLPWLNDFQNMQLLCFCIALVHLSIAKIWSIIRKFPSITFLSNVGWLFIVWGMFFVANMFVLGFPLPGFAVPLIYTGIALAFFFMVEPKRLPKVVGQELVPFILGVVGAGTDIVSYIRLFAVGLATVAVADATNTMASGLPLWAMIIVLLIGHGLNLILAVMAILVHAIRLNVLEFSGQLGMEWSGFQYNPLKGSQLK